VGSTPLLRVLKAVENWVVSAFWKSLDPETTQLFEQVRASIRSGEMGKSGPGARFIDLLIQIGRQDKLPESTNDHPIVSFDKDNVKLALKVLEGRLRTAGYAVPSHVIRKALKAEKLLVPHPGTNRVAISNVAWDTRRRRHVTPDPARQPLAGSSDESQAEKPDSGTVDSHASTPEPQS